MSGFDHFARLGVGVRDRAIVFVQFVSKSANAYAEQFRSMSSVALATVKRRQYVPLFDFGQSQRGGPRDRLDLLPGSRKNLQWRDGRGHRRFGNAEV